MAYCAVIGQKSCRVSADDHWQLDQTDILVGGAAVESEALISEHLKIIDWIAWIL
jgi:hypothetical protein